MWFTSSEIKQQGMLIGIHIVSRENVITLDHTQRRLYRNSDIQVPRNSEYIPKLFVNDPLSPSFISTTLITDALHILLAAPGAAQNFSPFRRRRCACSLARAWPGEGLIQFPHCLFWFYICPFWNVAIVLIDQFMLAGFGITLVRSKREGTVLRVRQDVEYDGHT